MPGKQKSATGNTESTEKPVKTIFRSLSECKRVMRERENIHFEILFYGLYLFLAILNQLEAYKRAEKYQKGLKIGFQ